MFERLNAEATDFCCWPWRVTHGLDSSVPISATSHKTSARIIFGILACFLARFTILASTPSFESGCIYFYIWHHSARYKDFTSHICQEKILYNHAQMSKTYNEGFFFFFNGTLSRSAEWEPGFLIQGFWSQRSKNLQKITQAHFPCDT